MKYSNSLLEMLMLLVVSAAVLAWALYRTKNVQMTPEKSRIRKLRGLIIIPILIADSALYHLKKISDEPFLFIFLGAFVLGAVLIRDKK